jgi:hypothetical protein
MSTDRCTPTCEIGDVHRAAVAAGVFDAPGGGGAARGVAAAQPFGLELGRHVQLGIDAHPHLHCGSRGEELERRSCAVADQRERLRLHRLSGIEVQPVGAVAGHRQHRMGLLTGLDHAHHAGDALEVGACDAVDRGLDRDLHVGVQRGLDHVAALGYLLLADACAGQILQHVVAEERTVACGDTAARELIGLRQDAQRFLLGGAQLVGVLGQVVDHGVQHQVSAS